LLLGLIALLGFAAIAAGTKPIGVDGKPNAQLVVPQLLEDGFRVVRRRRVRRDRDRRSGAGRDHVDRGGEPVHPHIYRAYFEHGASPAREAAVSKVVSLIVKLGALIFVLSLTGRTRSTSSCSAASGSADVPIDRGRPVPRWFHRWALLAGWAAG